VGYLSSKKRHNLIRDKIVLQFGSVDLSKIKVASLGNVATNPFFYPNVKDVDE
jgi:hypothetical protein